MAQNCLERIISEDITDYIFEFDRPMDEVQREYDAFCPQFASERYVGIYVNLALSPPLSIGEYSYTAIPKLYGLMDTGAVEATGALRLQNITSFGLTGRGVIVGFVDTGIDYTNNAFIDRNGNTRIVGIWDQTINTGTPPDGKYYGSEYTTEQINEALNNSNPQSIVTHIDTNGHGTFLAGVACGSEDVENSFIGAAPDSLIAMVKLKPAKQYLRDFYRVDNNADAYQENDIMLGISYLRDIALKENKPLVVVIGLGSSLGDHEGGAPLSRMLNDIGAIPGFCIVSCAGNEGIARHHFRGRIESDNEYKEVEIRVGENENGFSVELWGRSPDIYSIGMISPLGERVPRIPARVGMSEELTFLLEETVVNVDYRIVESGNGGELIFMRFDRPTPGIWTIVVYGNNLLFGDFDMWLPIREFVGENTFFVESNPDITITSPGNAEGIITVSAYDNRDDVIYAQSGRGYTKSGNIKPDISAPGVDVYGPGISIGNEMRYTTKSGTSVAAALTGGVCAQFLEWGIIRDNEPYMKTSYIKNYLIRGAEREQNVSYPNRQTGYGKINAYESFRILTRI